MSRVKYEYKIVETSKLLNEDDLNMYGENGWELVCIEYETRLTIIYHFKRIKYEKGYYD